MNILCLERGYLLEIDFLFVVANHIQKWIATLNVTNKAP